MATAGRFPGKLPPSLALLALERIEDAIAILDTKGGAVVFEYVNPAFERTFGYDPGEVIGLRVGILTEESGGDGFLRLRFDTRHPHRQEARLRTKSGGDLLARVDLHAVEVGEALGVSSSSET